MNNGQQPTIFHITHWKAGSQWVLAVLSECAPRRVIVPPLDRLALFLENPIIPGSIYPTVYIPEPRFEKIFNPLKKLDGRSCRRSGSNSCLAQNWFNFRVRNLPIIKFLVIRDFRDMLVSFYFSLKISHPIINDDVVNERHLLITKSFEDGFLHILNTRTQHIANIQQSWLPVCGRGEAMLVRYEDLIEDEQQKFAEIMEYCEIDIPGKKLEKIVSKYSFRNMAGRPPGVEDITSHCRKGIAGDWKNYFTDRIKAEFKKQYGQLLIDTGYEKDLNW